MKTTIQEIENKTIATLVGELDTTAAIEVEEALKPLLDTHGRDIVIDCTDLEYIASSGLRILLSILKQAKSHDCNLVLRNVNDDIKDVFRMTGFINIFQFE